MSQRLLKSAAPYIKKLLRLITCSPESQLSSKLTGHSGRFILLACKSLRVSSKFEFSNENDPSHPPKSHGFTESHPRFQAWWEWFSWSSGSATYCFPHIRENFLQTYRSIWNFGSRVNYASRACIISKLFQNFDIRVHNAQIFPRYLQNCQSTIKILWWSQNNKSKINLDPPF